MNRFPLARCASVIVIGTTTILLAGCGGRGGAGSSDCDTGMTDTTLKLGSSVPASGPAAAYLGLGNGAKAYFDAANKKGGIKFGDGKTRQVEVKIRDDGYDPSRTVTNARTLVQKDGVFAIINVLGTSTNLAIIPYLKSQGVPNLLAGTGSVELQDLYDKGAKVSSSIPSYDFEANVFAQYLKATKPDARVALLYQNDGFGKNYVDAYTREFKGSDIKIVAKQSYEVTGGSLDSQVVNLSKAGADVFLNYATGTKVTQALAKKGALGWDALSIVQSGATSAVGLMQPAGKGSVGAVSFSWLKDVASPQWQDDPGVKRYQAVARASGGLIRPDDFAGSIGYSSAQMLQTAMESMKGCKRADLWHAYESLSGVKTDIVLPGLDVSVDPKSAFVFREVELMTFNGKSWDLDDSKKYSEK